MILPHFAGKLYRNEHILYFGDVCVEVSLGYEYLFLITLKLFIFIDIRYNINSISIK